MLNERWAAARQEDASNMAKAVAALAAAPTAGRCGFAVRFLRLRPEPDVNLRCTKAAHDINEGHAVTDENGDAIVSWPHPWRSVIIRGCLL